MERPRNFGVNGLNTSKLRFALSLIFASTGESTGVWSVNLVSKLLTSSTLFWKTAQDAQ